ncbi:MAG: peptidase [Oscillospiraceae bacterium]|nr:peptidase [Oscillospiraceae bacterium]
MEKAEHYYYSLLNKEQQQAYHMILEGLLALKDSFPVLRLSQKEISDIYFFVRLDYPEIFWSVTFKYRYYTDSTFVELTPKYLFHKDKVREHQKAMDARIKKLCAQIQKMDEKEKEIFIHDFICLNVRYDKLKKEYSHEIIGSLGNGVAVCEGMAKAVKVLCDHLGIWCIVALSEANPEKGIRYRHAWNVIRIDGQYYHLDATFDNTISKSGILRHDYVNLSDKQIFRDHEPVIWTIPACTDSDHFYYKDNKISWTTLDEVRKRVKQAVKKGKNLLFHWRGGYLTKEVFQELLTIFEEESTAKNKYASCSVNWPQSVISVIFSEKKQETDFRIEQVNESEMEEA